MDAELAIQARSVVKKFGSVTAVSDLDLDVPKQSIFGFLGPNGSGKSTSIRVLLGLLQQTSGEIEVLGRRIPEQAESVRRDVGYMTQTFSLYRDLSARENLQFIAQIYGMDSRAAKQRVDELLNKYELRSFADRNAGETSGGQRQRLALAAAVLTRPKLLVLDEPTSAVDPQNRREFWDRLFDLVEQGTTILVSTHYMDEAERCHHLAILKAGRVAAVGEPPQMMHALTGQVFVATGSNLSAVRSTLSQQSSVIGVSQLGARLRILVEPGRSNALSDLAHTARSVAPNVQIAADEPNLEDVFVDATRESKPAKVAA